MTEDAAEETPYTILEVTSTAGDKEIKSSYRRLSKAAHPDAPGGSEAAFNKLKDAYDLLMDKDRRALFDETGRTAPTRITLAKLKTFIHGAMKDMVMARTRSGTSDSPSQENLLSKLVMSIQSTTPQIEQKIFEAQQLLDRATSIASRFSTDEEDVLGILDMLKGEVDAARHNLDQQLDLKELSERSVEYLSKYSYKVDRAPEGHYGARSTTRRGGSVMDVFHEDPGSRGPYAFRGFDPAHPFDPPHR